MASKFPRENMFQIGAATYGLKLSTDDKILMFMKENNYSQRDIYDEFKARKILKNSSWARNRWTRIRKELFALCLAHGKTFTKGDALVIPSMMNEGIVLVAHPTQDYGNDSQDAHGDIQSFDEDADEDVNESANESGNEDVNESAKSEKPNDATAIGDDQEMADASDAQEESEVDNGVGEESDSDSDKMSVDEEAIGEKPTIPGDEIPNAPTYDARAEVIVCNLPRHFTLRHAQQVFKNMSLQHIQPSSTKGVFSLLCTDAKVADFIAENWNARSVEGKRIYIIPAWKQGKFLRLDYPIVALVSNSSHPTAAIMPAIMQRRN